MTGSRIFRRAGVGFAAAAMLPAMAAAQSNTAAPQTNPDLDRFSLPPSARPSPRPTPSSGPIIAPLSRPTPAAPIILTPAPTPTPGATPAPRAAASPVTAPTKRPASSAVAPAPVPIAPTPAATSSPDATAPIVQPTPLPVASATPAAIAPTPAAADQASNGWPTGLLIAIGAGVLALVAAGGFLLGRRRSGREAELIEEIAPEPVAAPSQRASGHITIPARRRVATETAPKLEIILVPKRAGMNLMGAAVDYRVIVRNAGTVAARDVQFAMYMLSASARQAQDLQAIFAAPIEQPVVAPFALEPGGEIDLSGMAMLPREQVNVMTIHGKPWFVPVLAMKAEYRWGENVGAPGIATAAHMIGIDRGEGAKMAPFRLDGGPHMHPEVAERKVA